MRLSRAFRLAGVIAIAATVWLTACLEEPAPANTTAQFAEPAAAPTPADEDIVAAETESDAATPGFTEQDLPPPSPMPTALPSGVESPGVSASESPGAVPTETSAGSSATGTPSGLPAPADGGAAAGLAIPQGLISDAPLPAVIITSASNPASRVGLGLVEQARRAIAAHDPDRAIRLLGRALSIDPTDPYIYFYLGRAYLAKQNYEQALTFWQRATIGFGTNAPWLGETYGFEGAVDEQLGRISEARLAYQKALAVAPANQLAQQGYARLGPPPTPEPVSSEGLEGGLAPPAEATPAPAPEEPPPPPAP